MTESIKLKPNEDIVVTIGVTESAERILNFQSTIRAEQNFVTELAFFAERERFDKYDGEWDGKAH